MSAIHNYASYIIDVSSVILDNARGLNDMQAEQMRIINQRAVDFITTFMMHEQVPVRKLKSYLNHDAMSPITLIIGYAEVMLEGMSGPLEPAYAEAIGYIRDAGYALRDEIHTLLHEVLDFMHRMAIAT